VGRLGKNAKAVGADADGQFGGGQGDRGHDRRDRHRPLLTVSYGTRFNRLGSSHQKQNQ
jgi:hypothetical protein